MFTTAAPTCTATGAASAALVSAAACTAVVSGTSVIGAWYRLDGFGVPMNHKHPSRRPPSPTS